MKAKLLIMLFLLNTSLSLYSASVILTPKSDYIGVTRTNNSYVKQSAKDYPNEFFLGYQSGKTGRGFLQFDLSSIPTGVTITSASLVLSCKSNSDWNKKFKINIRRCEPIPFPDQITWNFMATNNLVGTCEVYAGQNVTFTKDLKELLIYEINSLKKKDLNLSLHLSSEADLAYFSANASELYLAVNYDGGSTNPGGGGTGCACCLPPYYEFPSVLYYGDNYYLGITDRCESHSVTKITYDSNLFSVVSDKKNYKIVTPKPFSGSKRTQITIETKRKTSLFTYDTHKYTWEVEVMGSRPSIKNNTKVVCAGDNIIYTVENLIFPSIGAGGSISVSWEPISNMTLISGQNSSSATFRASANGVGKVRAIVTVNTNMAGKKVFSVEDSKTWVGPPAKPTYIDGFSNGARLAAGRSYYLGASYNEIVSKYIWSVTPTEGSIRETNTWTAYLDLRPVNYGMTVPFTLTLTPTNVCGRGPTLSMQGYSIGEGFRSAELDSPISIEDATSINEFELNDYENIKAIRIYSISGMIVYTSDSVDTNFNYRELGLSNGIYIIERIYENGNAIREKVILKNK